MNILITGGTGLLGRALCHNWENQHQLTVLTRSAAKARSILPAKVLIEENIDNINFNQVDAVINLAGEPIAEKRWTSSQKDKICQSRWKLTAQLAGKIREADKPPHTFISGSAIGYYGRQGEQFIDESYEACYPEFTHTVCARWEALAQDAVNNHTRICILRTGIVLADNGGALKKLLPPFKMGLGGPISSGQQYMSWVHIDDMVQIFSFLLEHPTLTGVFNATAPEPVTNKAFCQALAKRLHRPALLPVPATVLKSLMGEMADMVLYGQRVIPLKLQQAGFSFHYPALPAALDALPL